MKVTLHHPESKQGFPVILDEDGNVMPVAAGIAAVLEKVGMTYPVFAACCGIDTSTLRQYGSSRNITANVLNMLALVLEDPSGARKKYATREALKLTPIEKDVLVRNKKGENWAEIGRSYGFSRQRAFQIAETAKGKLPKRGGE